MAEAQLLHGVDTTDLVCYNETVTITLVGACPKQHLQRQRIAHGQRQRGQHLGRCGHHAQWIPAGSCDGLQRDRL